MDTYVHKSTTYTYTPFSIKYKNISQFYQSQENSKLHHRHCLYPHSGLGKKKNIYHSRLANTLLCKYTVILQLTKLQLPNPNFVPFCLGRINIHIYTYRVKAKIEYQILPFKRPNFHLNAEFFPGKILLLSMLYCVNVNKEQNTFRSPPTMKKLPTVSWQ